MQLKTKMFRSSLAPLLGTFLFLFAFSSQTNAVPTTALRAKLASSKIFVASEGSAVTLWATRSLAHGATYVWDLDGDNHFETRGRRVSAIFSDNGRYVIRYRKTIKKRSKKSKKVFKRTFKGKKTLEIVNVIPSVNLGGPFTVALNESLVLNPLISDPSSADQQAGCSLSWDFGDGFTLEQGPHAAPADHSYAVKGDYTVSLVARDKDGGLSHVARAFVTVADAAPPAGSPAATPTQAPATPTPMVSPTAAPPSVVRPQEIFGIISNPGMGWQSTDKVNSTGRDAQGFTNKVAYIKYYWKDLETGNGVYNWSVLDQHLAQAHASNQKVALRIVVFDNITSGPTWLRNLGAAGNWVQYTPDGSGSPQVWSPRLTDSIFQQKHFAFLQALGNRYDGHPDLDSVDIGTVGLWGEWHYFAVSPAISMPSLSTMKLIIDKYFDNFSSTPLVAQLENAQALAYAVSRGAGFRGDCLGNVNNQMLYLYEPNITSAHAENAWRNGPINFETCWTISYWVSHGFNLRYIFDWALARHITGIANKNSTVPNSAIPEVERLLKKMGYRYVLRELRHPSQAHAGQTINLSMDWENIGVAPSYGNYRLGIQLKNASGQVVHTFVSPEQVRHWMPGAFQVDTSYQIPSNLQPGIYSLSLSVVDPVSGTPKVQISIAGKNSAGWYPLSSININ